MLSTLALVMFLQLPQEPYKAQDPTKPTILKFEAKRDKTATYSKKSPYKDIFLDKILKQYKDKYNFGDTEKSYLKNGQVLPEVLYPQNGKEFHFSQPIPDTWPKAELKYIPLTWEKLKIIETEKSPKKK